MRRRTISDQELYRLVSELISLREKVAQAELAAAHAKALSAGTTREHNGIEFPTKTKRGRRRGRPRR